MNRSLPKSYKGRYPFRLGTTSYIFPAGYAANIERLGPFFDEIELLFLESRPDSLPTIAERSEMIALADRYDVRYNVHLPMDLKLGHADPQVRAAAVETTVRLFEFTQPLRPTSRTLHLPLEEDSAEAAASGWRQRALDSLQQLSASGVAPQAVSLENLDYPIEWLDELCRDTGFRMCLDVGHLLIDRGDVLDAFDRFGDTIDVIHLHGVRDGRDHLSLAEMADQQPRWIRTLLEAFTGSLSLEVFSYQHLVTSLDFFEQLWENTV